MEKQFGLTFNGQQIIKEDIDLLGETSGLADDRVIAEFLRMAPYNGSTVSRAVLPYRHETSARTAMVEPNGASGSVNVNPFRALIGSRTPVATDAKKNWRDIRSGIGVGSTTLGQTVNLAANSSGNPRWDLVYAAVAVDANSAATTRKVKDPSSKLVTEQAVTTYKTTTVTLSVVAGTPAASPVWPSAPADSAGTYYIPLAYVRVPNGFNATSTVLASDIAQVAPCLQMSLALGGRGLSFANGLTATNVPVSVQQTWGSSGTRPKSKYMPSTAVGGESLIIPIDPTDITDGYVLDHRDWRNRMCKWTAAFGSTYFPWTAAGIAGSADVIMGAGQQVTPSIDAKTAYGFGSTFDDDGASRTGGIVAFVEGLYLAPMNDTGQVTIYCDAADGKLKLKLSGTVDSLMVFWIEFSAPFY